jgi:hypothetical protein
MDELKLYINSENKKILSNYNNMIKLNTSDKIIINSIKEFYEDEKEDDELDNYLISLGY